MAPDLHGRLRRALARLAPAGGTSALIAVVALSAGCAMSEPARTQLQIRQMQTRSYEMRETQRAVKAVLDVLQDEGYIPKEVNVDVGYIYAAKEVDLEDASEKFWGEFWHGRDATWTKNSIIECAANVSPRPDGVRVRLSFQVKVFDNEGRVLRVDMIDQPQFYQNFFARIDKGIFIEREGV